MACPPKQSYTRYVQITTSRVGFWRGILIDGLGWLGRVIAMIGVLVGLTVFSIVTFLLHQRWDLGTFFGLLGVIAVLLEGSWRRSCKEKDALDPEWHTKYARKQKAMSLGFSGSDDGDVP